MIVLYICSCLQHVTDDNKAPADYSRVPPIKSKPTIKTLRKRARV